MINKEQYCTFLYKIERYVMTCCFSILLRNCQNRAFSNTHQIQVCFKQLPVWFYHLKHHVVLEVLNKVQHSLTKGECRRIPACWTEHVLFRAFIAQPYAVKTQQSTFKYQVQALSIGNNYACVLWTLSTMRDAEKDLFGMITFATNTF